MYLSWEFVIRAGPESGVRVSLRSQRQIFITLTHLQDKDQTLRIYPGAKSYKAWVKDSPLVLALMSQLKAPKTSIA
jgi:hypothetical protein